MPVVTQILMETYGWRGTLLLLCGMCLHSVPCGALLTNKEQVQGTDDVTDYLFVPADDDVDMLIDNKDQKESNTFKGTLRNILNKVDASLFTDFAFITRVILPEFAYGYTFAGWLIYVVSFALSNGATMKEAAIVATWGGFGAAIIKITLPFLGKFISYKQLLYLSSIIMTLSMGVLSIWNTLIGMKISTCVFCIGAGILATEVHVAAKDIVTEDQFVNAISWLHLVYGFAAIASGTLTGLMFDKTGNFILSFVVLAAVSSLTMISLGVEDVYNGYKATF
ncbi:monocarboxylate transporter 6-like [Amphiura filiformis]|uniref:monocarboxylate transporter 6-like n=1 Tax=Amphiura filiformis TaxID=82378 RepID=UPI003B2184ED